MLTRKIDKNVYGSSVVKVNGETVKLLEYDGNSDGENIVLNINDNGKKNTVVVPDIEYSKKSHVFPRILNMKPDDETLINRLKSYRPSRYTGRRSKCRNKSTHRIRKPKNRISTRAKRKRRRKITL